MATDGGEMGGETEEVNLDDADVSSRDAEGEADAGGSPASMRRPTAPPPLPPSSVASLAPGAAPEPAARGPALYVVVALVVALAGGAGVATYVRRSAPTLAEPAAQAAAAAAADRGKPAQAVITIPTVEMDDRDGGP